MHDSPRCSPEARAAYEASWADVPAAVKAGLDRMIAADDIFEQLDPEQQEAVVEDFRRLRTPADYQPRRFRQTVRRARCFTVKCVATQGRARHRAGRGKPIRRRGSRRVTATRAGPDDSGGDKPPGEPPLAGRRSTAAGVVA